MNPDELTDEQYVRALFWQIGQCVDNGRATKLFDGLILGHKLVLVLWRLYLSAKEKKG